MRSSRLIQDSFSVSTCSFARRPYRTATDLGISATPIARQTVQFRADRGWFDATVAAL